MPFAVASDGVRLYYETSGTGEPLLLISGMASDHQDWDDVRDDFAKWHRVIVYDHRGTGQSDKPEQPPYSTNGFAQDVVALLDHLDIPRAHIYGVSMGGRICQWLGINYPERVGALVLGCTSPGDAHGVRAAPEVRAAFASADYDKVRDLLVSPGWVAAHPEFLTTMAEWDKHPIPSYAQALHFHASTGHDAWNLLPSIKAPTLIIHGSDDQVNPTANAYLLAGRIPGAELHIVQGGRHLYFLEFREEAGRVVREFLTRYPLLS